MGSALAAPSYDGVIVLGLTGADYEYDTGGGLYERNSYARFLNEAGQVAGHTYRYNASGYDLGWDGWLYDGSDTTLIGFSGTGYEYAYTFGGGGTYRNSRVQSLNNAGQVAGYTYRYNASGGDLGLDAWRYDAGATTRIGFIGTGYTYIYTGTGGGVYRYSLAQYLNQAGQVVGYSGRYNASGVKLGRDMWIYNGSATTPIGLNGTDYEYAYTGTGGGTHRFSLGQFLNQAGQVVGYSGRYNASGVSIGRDTWLYNGSATTPIGLNGTDYQYTYTGTGGGTYRDSRADSLNDAGQVAGYTYRYNASGDYLGLDAWIYDGGGTTLIGLTGSDYEYASSSGGTFRVSRARFLSEAGQAAGDSARYNMYGGYLGRDAWLYDGSTTTIIGLTGTDYEYVGLGGGTHRSSQTELLNQAGQVAGFTDRYRASGGDNGHDTWFYDGSTTTFIGLTGAPYEFDSTTVNGGTYRFCYVDFLNEAGQVVGFNTRRYALNDNRGRTAWFYDSNTATTYELLFSLSDDDYAYSEAQLLTEDGAVLGYYTLYDGTTAVGNRAFWWSMDEGFYDLGDLVVGLETTDWQYLADVVATNGVDNVIGSGTLNDMSSGQMAYLLVPEPSCLVILGLGGLMLARRRRAAI